MADSGQDTSQDKSEAPSDRRKEQFREEGQIAKSTEIPALITIVTSIVAFQIVGGTLTRELAACLRAALQLLANPDLVFAWAWVRIFVWPIVIQVGIFSLTLFMMVLIVSVGQTGLLFSWKSIAPRAENISPLAGIKRFFSMQVLVTFFKNLLKVIVISWIAYAEISKHHLELLSLASLPFTEAMQWGLKMLAVLIVKLSLFLAGVSLFDYLYQWFAMQKKMRMSKQELKEEIKENQIPDHVKAKVRRVATERAKQTIRKEVPQADVIITNPTHYSIAIRYRRGMDSAPRVVAKGKNHLAKLIRELATQHEVPLYEFPELARELYRKVRVGQTISEDLYESVARVLAHIYHIYQRRHKMTNRGNHVAL